ncbi:MAG: 2-oxoacid:ferredoxin oxidoreductase subunit beta [Armatimonadota bacterium]|nr:2-oxoacid:ferredoxin oxidoreductase subunit beta [Armatimonadota bacterium]MDR7486025.1 2-oxoacid:ferredoxin oxidoreductase subunit beta [Armatimonadota bacterium]MDR7532596.1 2-oxoacid:ferredoxin oxidoreductase subunit beta [Armatimonadota bacterium]MDR7536195.1 2-oxoacid:ferredoxin oxidoreductase subunit beta [Armatimonadota bacterium]
MPHILCPGCGHGIAAGALLRAIHRLGLAQDRVAVVAGIGCSSRLAGYLDFCTLHATHGRAPAFATGLKLARPDLHVVVITGDGDGLAIGGNHLIHAARRNIDLTCLLFNNEIYGMTGGQLAPTTPEGSVATTAPAGNVEPPFDACRLLAAAGATFVARGTVWTPLVLEDLIARGLRHRGFAFIEILSDCPEFYGRYNRLGSGAAMLAGQARATAAVDAHLAPLASTLLQPGPAPVRPPVETGVLVDIDRPEFTARVRAATVDAAGPGETP